MDQFNIIKKYAVNYLSKYDSSKKNLKQKLIQKASKFQYDNNNERKIVLEKINNLIQFFEKNKIIDDYSFAKNKIDKFLNQGKSKNYIKNSLYRKGISEEVSNEILKNIENINPDWLIDSAKKFIIRKKIGKYGNNNDQKKDLSKMARAGFSYSVAKKVLNIND
ncbi:MAG: Regulatory protein RecX [Alphaproteobacteria bacterium MarineAlpha5_Bin9]|nr:MAG: Regulatory protein RecX [Alphaproteobacteria bacterium MarineAlpha5_Bin9]|tara:strand:+ start:6076 stop:6567 length:492 start_codon:yes stop_codon:yes gene_type:complete